jgi:predicted MFS family arabinose efflux permease
MIDGFGWLPALVILAATALLIVPLAAGLTGQPVAEDHAIEQSAGDAFREACRIPSFWLLNLGFFVCGFHLAFVAVHMPAFLADKGFAPWLATAALTTVGVTNIFGSYGCGVLGGRYPKKYVLSSLYLARALIFLLFIVIPITEATVLIFSAAIGFLWLGTVPLTSGLVGHIFGTRYMSMIFGFVFLGHQIGGFLGAWLAGAAFDAFGTYTAMWWPSIGLGIMSAALHWPISERPAKVAFSTG